MYGAARASRPLVVEAVDSNRPYGNQRPGVPLDSCAEPGEVELHTGQWVGGTRAVAHYGPVIVDVFLADTADGSADWEAACSLLHDRVRAQARELGATAVCGLDVTADPWATDADGRPGLRLHAIGAAVKLEPITW